MSGQVTYSFIATLTGAQVQDYALQLRKWTQSSLLRGVASIVKFLFHLEVFIIGLQDLIDLQDFIGFQDILIHL